MIFDLIANENDFNSADRDKLTELICELLRVHRRGTHLLIIARAECDWISKNIDLSQRERATLLKIRHDFSQAGGLRAKALIRISIEVSHKSGPVQDGNRIVVGLMDALKFDLLESTQFIVEDAQYDGNLYLTTAEVLKQKIQAPAIRLELRNGGGQSSYNVWNQQLEAKRIVCMVVDSDRNHFSDEEKKEVKSARKNASDAEWPFAWALCLPCREVENIVPISILEQLPFALDKAAQLYALKRIEEVETSGGIPMEQRFHFYYDLKDGVSDKLTSEKTPEATADWWKTKIAQGGNSPCYNGFGSQIVRYLLEHSSALHAFLRYVKSDAWWNMFGEVFAMVLWAGFAPRPHAT